jgi:mono/diheme cytochrome c family protein
VLKKVNGKTTAIFAVVTAFAVAPMTTAQANEQPTGGAEAQISHGKTTYAERCSHCHGPNMVNPGTITPDLRVFPDDKTRFVTTVKNGKNTKMPPWGDILSEGEIMDLWAFVSSRRKP